MRVQVYFNLHKKCFSVLHQNKVIAHVSTIQLSSVQFRVREAGRQRVLCEKRKNVHAFVIGDWNGEQLNYSASFDPIGERVSYNPYQSNCFVKKGTNQPIFFANQAWLWTENDQARMMAA